MKKIVHVSGKRKTSVARATIKPGNGNIRINSVPLEIYEPELARLKIQEPLILASDFIDLNNVDIKVNVKGGGVFGQADAIRSSIARGLVEFTGSDELLRVYLKYDRTMIAGDHRQTEPHKPSQSRKGPRHKRQKSYR
ncbi:MAG: 30S ribosomal protein S9 [Candidatus Altiarchaeales archaeon]|nr:MAG: 30S ribosomal protein S9 [Candidatus Altiarchaeales archaeon]RLI94858.1 MAG: 30S ribosomal protein S9 [Candidatus Altiarchaeales archaeon]HDO82505.1 30S ribosomal protein S9 [Candidatus Altiarchaeales archaeon]HEX55154.1 30S ribosomal protein S9 [Candidatus Altiarchaeales archaeon]